MVQSSEAMCWVTLPQELCQKVTATCTIRHTLTPVANAVLCIISLSWLRLLFRDTVLYGNDGGASWV